MKSLLSLPAGVFKCSFAYANNCTIVLIGIMTWFDDELFRFDFLNFSKRHKSKKIPVFQVRRIIVDEQLLAV